MSVEYSGALPSKNKNELQTIANALNIADNGTKAELASRIRAYLDAHPELSEQTQFKGLYVRPRRKKSSAPTGRDEEDDNSGQDDVPSASAPLVLSAFNSLEQGVEGVASNSVALARQTRARALELISPRLDLVKATISSKSAETTEAAKEVVLKTRETLSSAWLIYGLVVATEVLYLLVTVVPAHRNSVNLKVPYTQLATNVNVAYPSPSALTAPALRSCLIHLLIPSVILPVLAGFLVHFRKTSEVFSVDVLVASATHVFLAHTYPYSIAPVHITHNAYPGSVVGLDVLGGQTRAMFAYITLAFALAETLNLRSSASSAPVKTKRRTRAVAENKLIEE